MNFNISVPINSLSFGFVGYNILKEIYNRGLSPCVFPIGGVDLTSFDRCGEDFKLWLQACINKAPKKYNRDNPEFRLWHLNGGETSYSKEKSLLTYYELDSPTDIEVNIARNQKNLFLSSNYTVNVFKQHGLNNVKFLPLGFDAENFRKIEKHPYEQKAIVFGIFGKYEIKRKKTDKAIKLWLKKYGNNPKYRLHLHVYNSFFHQDPQQCAAINANLINQCFEGRNYWNVNVINSHLATLTEYNQLINSIDICLDMSGGEGWNVPAMHATALGKHLVTHYNNAVMDWANEENAVCVPSNGKEEAYDGMFFHKGQPFNQGNFFTCSDEEFAAGMDKAVERYNANPINSAGLELQKKFTWGKTVDIILENL